MSMVTGAVHVEGTLNMNLYTQAFSNPKPLAAREVGMCGADGGKLGDWQTSRKGP